MRLAFTSSSTVRALERWLSPDFGPDLKQNVPAFCIGPAREKRPNNVVTNVLIQGRNTALRV